MTIVITTLGIVLINRTNRIWIIDTTKLTGSDKLASKTTDSKATQKARGITRGADYYRR